MKKFLLFSVLLMILAVLAFTMDAPPTNDGQNKNIKEAVHVQTGTALNPGAKIYSKTFWAMASCGAQISIPFPVKHTYAISVVPGNLLVSNDMEANLSHGYTGDYKIYIATTNGNATGQAQETAFMRCSKIMGQKEFVI